MLTIDRTIRRRRARTKPAALALVMALVLTGCGGSSGEDEPAAAGSETTEVVSETVATVGGNEPASESGGSDSPEPAADGADAPPVESDVSASDGGGVILADLCAGDQPLNGAISLDDLVTFGLLSSTDATIESSGAYDALAYETFGFLCNISENAGDGNYITIGVSAGSAIWDLAVEQGTAPAEQIGDWDVIVGSNWLSPLTMRATDTAGNQDSLFITWFPADGSIPDAATLERLMRPLTEAIAARSTVDIPRT